MEFKPDILCGEVHPLSWEKYMKDKNDRGYWGEPASEYWELVFPLCEEYNIKFVPIDWFELDVWNNFDPFDVYNDKEKKTLMEIDDQWFEKQMSTHSHGAIPFNSKMFDEVTKKKYEWLNSINYRTYNFRWNVRNQIMVERVRNTYKSNPGKRILCLVGADHNYFFHHELRNDQVELKYPLR